MKVFGAGCIYFGYLLKDENLPDQVNFSAAYFSDIKNRLERVENVSSVTINNESDVNDGSYISISKKDAKVAIPMLHGAHLEFDLYLPFRVQKAIYGRCDVELVHVDMVWAYEMPLTFVSYDWPDEEGGANPSSAIVVVRKYLEKKLSDSEFVCGCVGPSPFHGDFSLIESDLNDGFKVSDVSTDRLGYASIELSVPPRTTFLHGIYESRLENLLSNFYYLSECRSQGINEQTSIVANSKDLLGKGAPKGFREKFVGLWRRPIEIDALNKHVFQEMLIRLDMSTALSEAERYRIIGSGTPLDRFFDRFREMAIEENWAKFADVAKFFEERHQKSIGNITAVVAGIIGGIVGSLIGALATYFLTRT